MAEPKAFPEEEFVCAALGGLLARRCRALLLSADSQRTRLLLRRRINRALQVLSYRERGVLEMRYGLGDGHFYTLAEVGYVFNLTRERIRQIQVRSLVKLQRCADELRTLLTSDGDE
jgi:RNA polymerase sigma factor (sigma-70 family)